MVDHLLDSWVKDIGFVIDRLMILNTSRSGRLGDKFDLGKIAVIGHSLGGASAAQFCHDDPRVAAGIDIDGRLFGSVAREGIRRPFMFLLSDHGNASSPVDRQIMREIKSVYDRMPVATRVAMSIQ